MKRGERFWIFWMVLVALVDVAIPFGVVGDGGAFRGAFGFWIALTLMVIVSGAFFSVSWGSPQDGGRR